MEKAYILVNSEGGKLWDIAKAAAKVEGVKMTDAVTGEFDVIVYAELDDLSKLGKLVNDIRSIDGVTRTQTCIAISYFVSP